MQRNAEWVRKLGSSRFNYWFGYVANLTLVAWLLGHAWPLVGAHAPLTPGGLAVRIVAGLGLWTLAEYVLHRYVYHVIPSALSVGHALHHDHPRELIGVPWWLTSVLIVGLYAALARALEPAGLGVVMASTWGGYIAYCLLHHGSHHWSMRRGHLRAMKQHHQLHHAYPAYNWGFTTSFWDRVFRTYRAPGARRAAGPIPAAARDLPHGSAGTAPRRRAG